MKKKILSLLVAALAFTANSVTFEWDHSPDPLVTGYRLYWGTSSNTFTMSRPSLGRTNAITILDTNFTANVPQYFVVVATNAAGIESLPSNTVIWTNIVPPSAPKNLRIIVSP